MSDDLKDTQPNLVQSGTEPNPGHPETVKKFPRWLVACVVVLLITIGVLGGYTSGMIRRYTAQSTLNSGLLQDQYQLGMQAMNAGNYENANKYFKFIIQTDPNFPGIQTAYNDLLIKMKVSPTPEFSPTPYVSPTPDLRGADQIFNTAQQLLNSGDWDGAITNLDSLRKTGPTYRTAEVDGMYYMALRQRGVAKITAACQDTNLEGGIYDLTLAEHFIGNGNLDSNAQSLRTYARLYIIGASFWDQDWVQAQNFFAQVMTGYPHMSDSSCLTATKRWYQATIKYAEQLMAAGDACGAAAQYASAFGLNLDDPLNLNAFPAATAVQNQCNPPSQSTPTETPTETPTGAPTEVPTETPTATP
ncbi:MAG TPA: tetratricopeptide repeat protein [Anaerolineales bacterium]